MNEVAALTGANVSSFFTVFAALCGLFILVTKAWEAAKSWRKPKETITIQKQDCDRKFANDQRAISNLQKQLEAQEEISVAQCNALRAIIGKLLHNGNNAELEQADKDLFDCLNRKCRP